MRKKIVWAEYNNIPVTIGIDNSDALSVGMDSERGGESESNNSSDGTHTNNDVSQDIIWTGLSTPGFEALDRKRHTITH